MTTEKKELVSGKIYRMIREKIVLYRYQPGLRINVEELTRELGASRGSVWEAIRRLQQEGVLQNIPNRGVFMAKNSFERALQQLQVQGNLERLAGRLACERVTDRLVKRLSGCLKDQLVAIDAADLLAYSSADHLFHRLVYEASGNNYLTEIFELITLHLRTIPSRSGIPTILSSLPSVFLAHQEILEGLAAQDPARVEQAFYLHEELVTNNVKQQLQAERERKEIVRRNINKTFGRSKS
jgi:DNA-binding GntR family transcriptional regulator